MAQLKKNKKKETDFLLIREKYKYRETFNLELPPKGSNVYIDWLAGCNFSIVWNDCKDGEDILFMWIPKRDIANRIIKNYGWVEVPEPGKKTLKK